MWNRVAAFHVLKQRRLVPFTFTVIQLGVSCRFLYILLYHTQAFFMQQIRWHKCSIPNDFMTLKLFGDKAYYDFVIFI